MMEMLVTGLVVFLAAHSVRIFADNWRTHMREMLGDNVFKAAYAVVSLVGLGLIIWGFGMAREQPVQLWSPPVGMRHAASLLTLVSFVFLAATYVPGNAIKARLGHPMVLGVKVWALAHLLANGTLAHVALFGSFLIWSVLCFRAARQRDRAEGVSRPAGNGRATALTVVVGVLAWAVFAFGLHGWLIGVKPMG
jgi:uncharacterized membrane protein